MRFASTSSFLSQLAGDGSKLGKDDKTPVSLSDLLLDVYDHYNRMSKTARKTEPADKSFAKTYAAYTKLLDCLVDILKMAGTEAEGDDLAGLLEKIPAKHVKKAGKVLMIVG